MANLNSLGRHPTDWRQTRASRVLAPVLLFCLVFAAHSTSPVSQSAADSRWSMHIAMSLVCEGDLDLDEYAALLSGRPDYRLAIYGGHLHSVYPLGAPLLATPWVWAYSRIDPQAVERVENLHAVLEIAVASFLVALSALFMYLVFRTELSIVPSLFLSLVYAFCTSAWSTASRALWQHGPSMLMLAMTLYLFLRARQSPSLWWVAGLPLAYSFIIRPTNSLSVVALSLYVLFCHPRHVPRYLLAPMLLAAGFFLLNHSTYGAWVPAYYTPGAMLGGKRDILAGLLGTLVSPSRGLLVFSPVLLLALWGMRVRLAQGPDRALPLALAAVVALHWVLLSANPYWWGGHSFGPRLFADMLPFLSYFFAFVPWWERRAVPSVSALPEGLANGPRRSSAAFLSHQRRASGPALVLALLVVPSFLIHLRGATDSATYGEWNNLPYNVDQAPERLWDWSDPQFLRHVALVDALIPLRVEARPSVVLLRSGSKTERDVHVSVELADVRYRAFSWRVTSEPGVRLSTTHGAGVERETLLVGPPVVFHAPGLYELDPLVIEVQGERVRGRGIVMIPVNLQARAMQDHYFPIARTP